MFFKGVLLTEENIALVSNLLKTVFQKEKGVIKEQLARHLDDVTHIEKQTGLIRLIYSKGARVLRCLFDRTSFIGKFTISGAVLFAILYAFRSLNMAEYLGYIIQALIQFAASNPGLYLTFTCALMAILIRSIVRKSNLICNADNVSWSCLIFVFLNLITATGSFFFLFLDSLVLYMQ